MKKVLFVATVVKKHINAFHLPFLKMFKQGGWETSVCARNDFDADEECAIPYCDKYYNMPFERFPLKKENYTVYKNLKRLIESEKYDIIHCHTPVGGILSRLAARSARKHGTRVIYTAHGFHFFKGAPLINWLLYYPAEWICSWFTDCLITINQEDYKLAKKMHAKCVKYVPGVGIDIAKFRSVEIDKNVYSEELNIPEDAFVILSVGELTKRKNHRAIIEAIGKLKNSNIYYIICGQGELKSELKSLAKELSVDEQIRFLGFRYDIPQICKYADMFAFPSQQEGLPVAMMEAMAAGLPVVCSKIRGNSDLMEDGKGGYLCNFDDVDRFTEGIKAIYESVFLRQNMKKVNLEKIQEFDRSVINECMRVVYSNVSQFQA